MNELLNALLKVSRLGKTDLQLEKLNITKLVADVTRNFNYVLNNKNVQLSVRDLPSCIGDSEQISQVFFNLLDNALKYLDPQQEGTINIIGEIHDNNTFIQ
jgi:signal transduction histidine kinase